MTEDDGAGPSTEGWPWWRTGVLYQIYPRSFADSDGDGIGDLGGIIDHLDHLQWLGVDGIWLSPVTVSPNADWGYDVSDYRAIQPDLGTSEDLDRLIAEARSRGIRVLMDLVPNHTSDRHPWFLESRSATDAPRRSWYVWADPKADGSAPNNWVSSFGGPAWTLDPRTGQYYLHNHLDEQPDLNWWDDEVRREFDDILTYWLDRGVAGFRIDVCNIIIKDALLRDNPPATDSDPPDVRLFGQRPVYNGNRPEVHDVIRRWRQLADRLPRLRAGGRDAGRAGGVPGRLLRQRGRRAAPGLQLPLHQCAAGRGGHAGRRRGHRGGPAVGGLAGMDRLQPRHVPFRHAGGPAATRTGPGWPCSCCCASGARPSCTRGTRSDWATSWWPRRTCATPWASGTGRTTPAGTACGPRCPGGTPPVAGSPSPASVHGCRSGTWVPPTSRTNGTTPTSMLHLARDLIALRRDSRLAARRCLPDSGDGPGHLGVEPGRGRRRGGQHDRRHRCRGRRHRSGADRHGPRPGRRVGGRRCPPGRGGRPSWSSGPTLVGPSSGVGARVAPKVGPVRR